MLIILCFTDAAVTGKITAVNAKLDEFTNLADKTDDDNTAISHLNTVKGHLNAVSSLLSGRRRRKRSDTGKQNIDFLNRDNFQKIIIDCNKWTSLKERFEAVESLVNSILALSNLNSAIREYVEDEVLKFVNTHMATIEAEIRYIL